MQIMELPTMEIFIISRFRVEMKLGGSVWRVEGGG